MVVIILEHCNAVAACFVGLRGSELCAVAHLVVHASLQRFEQRGLAVEAASH